MQKTRFEITKMDCPSEENLIRMSLDGISNIQHLEFDVAGRSLTVYHNGELTQIEQAILGLDLGGKLIHTEEILDTNFTDQQNQKVLLWSVLGINLLFFVIEITTGLISRSMGLVADSLDMLADAFVYGISIFAIGHTTSRKKQVAKLAGYAQLLLAIIGFSEVLRRFFSGETLPNFQTMILVSLFALAANTLCLFLLQKSKGKEEAHIKASLIFTSNDVIINLGVIVAGAMVYWLNSNKPDLIIGTIVFMLVVQGALRILKLGK